MTAKEKTVEQQIDSIFKSESTNGVAACALMFDIVEALANTRNSDPLRRFMKKANDHSHPNFKNVMGLFIRAYFGEKQVVAKASTKHPTGYDVTLKFAGNPGPSNHWGHVRAQVERKGHYLDREFLKGLRESMNPDDEKTLDLSEQEVAAKKRIKNVIKFIDDDASSIGLEKLVNMLRQEWKDAHPVLTEKAA
jgi:hypothetical protein